MYTKCKEELWHKNVIGLSQCGFGWRDNLNTAWNVCQSSVRRGVEVNFWPAEWEVVHNFPDLTTEDRTVFHWFYINERVQRYPNEWLSSTLISKRWMYTIKKNRYCACVQRVCRCVCFMDERWRDTVVVLFGRRQKNHNGRVTKIVTNGRREQTTSCHSHLLEVKIQRAGRWKWFWYSYGNERRTRCCGKGNEGTYRPNQKEGIDTGC